MNKKQREIIADAYELYIRNAMRGDPVGGFSDFADLFSRLRKTDKRLDKNCKNATTKSPTNKDASPGTVKGCRGLFYPLTSVTPTATAWGLTAEVSVARVTKHSSSCCTRSWS